MLAEIVHRLVVAYRAWHAKHPTISALLLFLVGLIVLRTTFAVVLWLASFANAGELRHAVVGNVTWEGKPLKVGIISFRPLEEQRFNSGAAIQDGAFSIPSEKGLLPGKYLVRINSAVADPSFPAPPPGERDTRPGIEILPERYNAQSALTAEIRKWGRTRLSFELKP